MKQVQLALATAILLVLCLIAFQLMRLNRQLEPFALLSEGVARSLVRAPETREQRNLRLQHQTQETIADVDAILDTPAAPKKKPTTQRH